MKKLLLIFSCLFAASFAYSIEPQTPYLGNDPRPCNVTVSSTTSTQLMTTQADLIGDWLVVNHGDYTVYISTYSISHSTNATTATNVFKLETNESLNLDGRTTKNFYAITEAGSASNRLDMMYVIENR
jgi:hypothetical protein